MKVAYSGVCYWQLNEIKGATAPDKDIPRYVDMVISGKLKLNNLISHSFELDRINDAFRQLQSGEANRILIEMAEAPNRSY